MKIFFCSTVSAKLQKSWSNIPYFLERGMVEAGYTVENIVLRELWPLAFLYNSVLRIAHKIFQFQTTYYYTRTKFHFFIMKFYGLYIRLVSSSEDIVLQQGYSFPVGSIKNKLVLLGDWPYAYYFYKFSSREPNAFEKRSIKREDDVIEGAQAVVTLFPDVYEFMLNRYQNKKIFYFGNVVNVDVDVPKNILQIKESSRNLLFIGREHYLTGAIELIEALKVLWSQGERFHLDVVGIPERLLGYKFPWLTVHGYLDKDNILEKALYYDLLLNARVYVNPTEGWNAFQATLEAMHFSCPIVVKENDNLRKSFSRLEDFSYLITKKNSLQDSIKSSLSSDVSYINKAKLSGEASSLQTWKHFIDELQNKVFYE